MFLKNKTGGVGRRLSRRSVFFVLFFSYLVLMCVALLGNYIFYAGADERSRLEAQRTRDAMMEQIAGDLNFRIEEVSRLATKILYDEELDLIMRNIPSNSVAMLQRNLLGMQPNNPYIIDYYVYLRATGTVVTPNIKMRSESFYNTIYSYPELGYEDWRSNLQDNYYMMQFRPSAVMSILSRPKNVITFIQSAPISLTRLDAQVIILVDADLFGESLEKMSEASLASVYFVDKDGAVIIGSKGAGELPADLFNTINSGGAENSRFVFEKMMVEYRDVSNTGYRVIMTMDSSVYFRSLYELRGRFVLQVSIMVVLGLALAYFFSRRNYAPIKEIVEIIDGGYSSENELYSIKKAIETGKEERRELTDTLSAQLSEMQLSFFRRRLLGTEAMDLTGGEDREKRLEEELSSLGIELISQCFGVVSLLMDQASAFFREEEKNPGMNMAAARLIIENMGTELLGNAGVRGYYISLERNLSVFVINLPEGEDLYTGFETAFAQLDRACKEHFELRFFAGAGRVRRGLRSIYECIDEARKAMDYGMLTGSHALTHFDKVVDLDNDYFYPIELEIQLSNLLRVGDAGETAKIINSVFELNFDKRKINARAGRCLVVELSGTLLKVMNSMLAQAGGTLKEAEGLQQQLLEMPSFEDMKNETQRLAVKICEMSHAKQSSQTERLVGRIEKFITESEEWLDLVTIAANFNITPQYLSTVFKKYKNENIKEFISKMRLEKAKTMLCATELTVEEVAQNLGYANETGLNRLFKKYEGITPGAYRSSRRGAERL